MDDIRKIKKRRGHRLELKDINCESWLKLRGGKIIFGGEDQNALPQTS